MPLCSRGSRSRRRKAGPEVRQGRRVASGRPGAKPGCILGRCMAEVEHRQGAAGRGVRGGHARRCRRRLGPEGQGRVARGVAPPGEKADTFMVMTDEIRAGGGIVWRTGKNGVVEIALVHRPKYDDWTLPKGKPLPGETEEETAAREVEEETGMRCVMERPIGRIHYVDRRGRPKTVRYWLMRPISGSFTPSDEVDELRWLSLDQAEAILSYEHDRWLLQRFAHPATSMRPGLGRGSLEAVPIYLVRHAKAGNRGEWTNPDHLRPLSENGKQQAEQ